MADTPLHEHEAVKHLLASELCPTREGVDDRTHPLMWREGPGWTWGFTFRKPCGDDLTTSLTLAAVRALCCNGDVHSFNFGPCNDATKGEFYATIYHGLGGATHFFAPTEPLAILAAYQATVMEQGAPDAKPE